MKGKTVSGALCLMLAASLLGAPQARGQENPALGGEASRMDSLAASKGEGRVFQKLSGDFEPFLGKDSGAVVASLRNGTPVTLTETVPGQPPAAKAVTIAPTTGKMGYGNVFISLALAKSQLAQAGVTQPTPSQLQAALTGGSVTNSQGATTQMQGVLAMRSQGMGWGQIARATGANLGSVVSGMKAANHGMATAPAGAAPPSVEGKGVVNAGGQGGAAGAGREHGKKNEGIVGGSGRPGEGAGIVTGEGTPAGPGQGNAFGREAGGARGSGRGRGR